MNVIISQRYGYKYTTAGGAHRYSAVSKRKANAGDIYLRGLEGAPPKSVKVTIES
jgi:hypothetical protein